MPLLTHIFPSGPAIHGFDSLVTTANKLFKAAKARRVFTTLILASLDRSKN